MPIQNNSYSVRTVLPCFSTDYVICPRLSTLAINYQNLTFSFVDNRKYLWISFFMSISNISKMDIRVNADVTAKEHQHSYFERCPK